MTRDERWAMNEAASDPRVDGRLGDERSEREIIDIDIFLRVFGVGSGFGRALGDAVRHASACAFVFVATKDQQPRTQTLSSVASV